jgi:hypothetical protein
VTTFSKVFERLIYDRLITHIGNNNILVDGQHGFRTHSPTEKAAFTLIHEVLLALNSNKMVGGIFFDLQKVFDCVSHTILMHKLEFCGIAGKFRSLISYYLTGRQQRVVLNNNSSSDNMCNWPPVFLTIYKRSTQNNK